MDDAWEDLQRALSILARHKTSDISPFHCEHDTLCVNSDPEAYTPEELAELNDLGFFVSEDYGCFLSYRFGSA